MGFEFNPITNLIVHTYKQPDGSVGANFDGPLLPEYRDDALRKSQPAHPPNERSWRLDTEEDCANWFHAEISNVVLAGWTRYPDILQVAHAKPFSEQYISETVDVAYTDTHRGNKIPVILGEMKRNLLDIDQWQDGALRGQQVMLSRELRGYAYKYTCPHIYCFDGGSLLLLQFRARNVDEIKEQNCAVDCWVFPRDNQGGCPLRYAFYRFLAQGFRRFQSLWSTQIPIGGILPYSRLFFSGQPVWRVGNGIYTDHPGSFEREVDHENGAFYWKLGENGFLNGNERLWDTGPVGD